MQDVRLSTPEGQPSVIDSIKVRRDWQTIRSQLQEETKSGIEMIGVFFDGWKDSTLEQVKKGKKYYRQTVRQENIVIVKEPGSSYFWHVVPKTGTAKDINESIVKYLQDNINDIENIAAVGCDGTVINTVPKARL